MIRIVSRNAVQFREQFRRNLLRFGMFHPLNYAVSSGFDGRKDRLRFKPIQQKTYSCTVIGGSKRKCDLRFTRQTVCDHIRAAQTNTVNLPVEPPLLLSACIVNRESYARRTPVDCEDAGPLRGARRLRSPLQGACAFLTLGFCQALSEPGIASACFGPQLPRL